MADTVLEPLGTIDPELMMLINNKTSGYNYRFRRQQDWFENYTLYRDRVVYNRLTQRQTVNLPVMKTILRTLLKDVDDMPEVVFESLDNDKEAEILVNKYWEATDKHNKMELQDIIDKRQVFHFGRSFDQWQVVDGMITQTIVDPQDILVSRYTNPENLHSSRFLVHQHIFKPLKTLQDDPMYDQEAIKDLIMWHGTQNGLIKAADTQASLVEKNRIMMEMGLMDVEAPILGETYVELTMHFVWHKEGNDTEEEIYLYVEADQYRIIYKGKLEDVIDPQKKCKDHFWAKHFPYNTWADDIDRQDFWTDGVADIVRTPNKILNTWFSQLVENRTLRSFGMMFYNASIEGFVPQTYEPKGFGWYGIPVPQNGNIASQIQPLQIPDLKDSLDEMNFVLEMVQNASGATSTDQGATQNQPQQITLGEVQLALGEAKERIKGMAKFYNQVWEERATMFMRMTEAANDKLDTITIFTKGRITDDLYPRDIHPSEFMTPNGYRIKVWNQVDKVEQDTQNLEKLSAAVQNIPDNPKLMLLYYRKLLEFSNLQPDEIEEIMKIEEQKMAMMQQQAQLEAQAGGQPGQPGAGGAPGQPQLPGQMPQPGGMPMPQPPMPQMQPQLPAQAGGGK